MQINTDRENRLRFLNIDQQTCDTLQAISPVIEPHLEPVLDKFYQHIFQWSELKLKFTSDARVNYAKQAQAAHW